MTSKRNIRLPMHYLLPAVLACCFSVTSYSDTLKIGLVEYPLHASFNHNIEVQPAVEYVRKALQQEFSSIEFIRYPNKRAQAELARGNIDLLFPVAGDLSKLRTLSKPLFYSTPGLCFKKKQFIPVLSAVHRFEGLIIGVTPGVDVVPILKNSGAKLSTIEGSNALTKGTKLLLSGLIDALYHPNPAEIYHHSNAYSKKIACAYFFGYSSGVHILAAPNMDVKRYLQIDRAIMQALAAMSYEFYFAQHEQ